MAIREVDLGSVIGPAGPQGPKGDTPDISNKQDIINISGILKGTLNGQITAAAPGVDYPSVEQLAAKQDEIHVVGLLKGDGNSVTAAVAGTDYATAQQLNTKQSRITATGILKGDGNGGVTAAVANTDYATTRLATAAYSGLMGTAQFTKLNVIDDYVIEQGTSGIWTYRKWNSGIKECWTTTTYDNVDFSRQGTGSPFYTQNNSYGVSQPFPSGLFVYVPTVVTIPMFQTGYYPMLTTLYSVSAQSFSFRLWFGTGGAGQTNNVTCCHYAIGHKG